MNVRSLIANCLTRYSDHLLIAAAFSSALYYAYFVYRYGILLDEIYSIPTPAEIDAITREMITNARQRTLLAKRLYIAFCLIFLIVTSMIIYWRKSQHRTNKIIERLEWTINRLAVIEGLNPKEEARDNNQRWPWGGHHTDALGHLEAAAKRFWTLYDPAESSTAPTNEMVAEWLKNERGVSKDKAAAIASILRADGLKPGPRR